MAAPLLSVVICTLNEAEAIGGVLADVGRALAGVEHEIIVVDDGSTDGTPARVLASGDPRVRLLERTDARGLASAAIAGWDVARGELLAIMDGDGQHDPALLPAMLARVEGRELVVASRNMAGGALGLTRGRAAISRSGTRLSALVLGAHVSDPLSGCFLMRRSWYGAARPKLSGVGFKILVDLLASAPRPRLAEVPTTLRPRAGGVSKLDARVVLDLGALLLEKRTGGVIPARFVLFAGVGVSGVVVQSAVLALAETAGATFRWSLAGAILLAMVWNFVLNNALTYQDRRLIGAAFWRGLVLFCLACSAGAVVNWSAGSALEAIGAPGVLAGVAGAVLGGVWNYWATRRTAWGRANRHSA